MAQAQTESETESTIPPVARSRSGLRFLLLIVGPLLFLLGGSYFYITSGRYVTTENAYIKANKIAISTDVDGRVVNVLVTENEIVTVGQLLFELDQRPHEIALNRAEAELAIVANEIDAYRAVYRQELAQRKMAEDDLELASKEYRRQQKLVERGIISQSAHDNVRHQLRTAQKRLTTIDEDITQSLANLAGDPDLVAEQHPRYLRALAERDQALLNLEHTVIKAPTEGIVSNISLQEGEYVEAGEAIFSLLSSDALWITANLKETELTHVEVGQQATVRVDAYPDHAWQATVASISPATGAEFSLLPPQNASGNWVKVVQRIPVRLSIKPEDMLSAPALRAGMSLQVTIDTLYERPLPNVLRTALAWIKENQHIAAKAGSATDINNVLIE